MEANVSQQFPTGEQGMATCWSNGARSPDTQDFTSVRQYERLWCNQSTCLPLMQEITGAKPVRDTNSISPLKHWQRCIRSVSEFNSVQLRVRAPDFDGRPPGPQSSQRSSRFHTPAVPRAALGIARHLHAGHQASTQQPADFFCKETLSERHRLENPISLLA